MNKIVARDFFMAVKIVQCAWEAQAMAYYMYLSELKEPSGDKQLTMFNFADGAAGK